jgi:Zn-dependent alcohol dehydrogenase
MRQMRSALFVAPGHPLQLVDDVEIDEPRDGEALVRVRHCGVCHSDLSIIDGAMPYPTPAILGHEASGTIAALGPGVANLSVGDRVVISMRPPCGHCYWCVRDEPVLCAQTAGPPGGGEIRAHHRGGPVTRGFRLGAFSELVLVGASGAVPVPDGIPLDVAAVMGCAIQTGIGSVTNVARVEAGATAVVFGLGGVGLAVVQGLVLAGASTVIGIDPVESRRRKAESLGATLTLDGRAADTQDLACALTRGIGFDHAFDTVSTTETTSAAVAMLRRGGGLVLIGVSGTPQPLGVTAMDLVMRQKSVRGSFLGNCHAQRDLPRYFDLCNAGRLDLAALITDRRPLSQINEALADLRNGVGVRTVLEI